METAATMMPELSDDMVTGLLGGGFLGMTIGVMVTIALVYYIVQVIAYWRMFVKMGEPGWKSIIPVYNNYVLYKRTWKPVWFWIMLIITFASGVISTLDPSTVVTVLSVIVLVIGIIVTVMSYHKISKSFGHGAGFTVGLIFLPVIFTMIIGFGSSTYKGADL